MQGAHVAEVALIEGEDAVGLVASGKDHDGEVGEADVQVGVSIVQCGRREVIGPLKAGYFVPAGGEIAKECPVSAQARTARKEVVDLGGHYWREDWHLAFGQKDSAGGSLVWMKAFSLDDDRACIDE